LGVAVIFPGQGAQAPGLGTPWVDHPAWALVERAEKATGESLAALLTDAVAEDLARTREAQLVVFLASLLAWEVAGPALDEARAGGAEIVAYGGHSLGQITALVAAGALPFDDGCRLAARRARHTQDAADARPGRLAALLGATVEQAQDSCAAAAGACWIANDNAPGQVVIGGTPEGLEAASAKAKELGVKRVMALNVGGAFHTPLMQAAADAFAADLAAAPFADTTVPVFSNHDAQPYTDAAGWPERLTEQLIRPVRWAATMPALVAAGATTFVEVGPGTTLTGLAKRAHPDVTLRNVATPADLPLEIAHA
jgi:[acyl-carrier-protein] S-malonyltransferase